MVGETLVEAAQQRPFDTDGDAVLPFSIDQQPEQMPIELAQALIDSHGPLVVLTTVGSFGALVVVVSTPGLSHVFGCTPLDPLAWGQALAATAVATVASVIAPDLLVRASEAARRIIRVTSGGEASVDDEDSAARV